MIHKPLAPLYIASLIEFTDKRSETNKMQIKQGQPKRIQIRESSAYSLFIYAISQITRRYMRRLRASLRPPKVSMKIDIQSICSNGNKRLQL